MKDFLRRFNLIVFLVAFLFLVLMLGRIDWGALGGALARGGRYWPLILLPYGVTSFLWTVSWRTLLVGCRRPPLARLFFTRLAGESLNQLTPSASFGGEPYKAQRLNALGVPWAEAASSLVIHRALTALGLVLYVALSLLLLPLAWPGIPPAVAVAAVAGTILLAAGAGVFIALQRRRPSVSLMRLLQRHGICPTFLPVNEVKLAQFDACLSSFYRDHAAAGAAALLALLGGWAFHAVELYLIFLALGHPITFSLAFCLDALSQLVSVLGFMIPASLGVQDGGNMLLSVGFRLGATLGAAFSIMRRFREAVWLVIGVGAAARGR